MTPTPLPEPVRAASMTVAGRALSCPDFGGSGRPLRALHGHLDQGRAFVRPARALSPDWRVVAPDRRGHGSTDREPDVSRQGHAAEAAALITHLGPERR